MIGVYNTVAKKFQFGISKPTVELARRALFDKIGKDAYKWRFEYRTIPGSELSIEEKIAQRKHRFKPGRPLTFGNQTGKAEMVDSRGVIHATMDDGSYIKIELDEEVIRLKCSA